MTRAGRHRCLLGLALAWLLAGCGFQPIYMPTASGKAGVAQRELTAVYVTLMPDRPGQVFRQALQADLGDDSGTPQRYDLDVTFWIAGEGIAVTPDSIATRIRLTGSVAWSLHARDANRTRLTAGSGRMVDGLNLIGEQYFASDLETEVVRKRIATTLAQQIATQLGIYFRHRAETPG